MKTKPNHLTQYFIDVETTEEHGGYFISVPQVVTIIIMGSLCGLKNISQIHQWASTDHVTAYLKEKLGIKKLPSYFWLTHLFALVEPDSLNQCFIHWMQSLFSEGLEGLTVSFDGKTARSTQKMKGGKPLHIVSAHVGNLRLTLGQVAVGDKTNEIPAVRELIAILDLKGAIVVADALNCQKETAAAIIEAEADYLLNVKGNHRNLKSELQSYVQDPKLKDSMGMAQTKEINRGRLEERTAYATDRVNWLDAKDEWPGLSSFGAIHRKVTEGAAVSEEWHYFISSRAMSASEMLHHARLEWTVETMHYFLDVHYLEDSCRIRERNSQRNLNMARKISLNLIRRYKAGTNSRKPMSHIMLKCLLELETLTTVWGFQSN